MAINSHVGHKCINSMTWSWFVVRVSYDIVRLLTQKLNLRQCRCGNVIPEGNVHVAPWLVRRRIVCRSAHTQTTHLATEALLPLGHVLPTHLRNENISCNSFRH